MKRLLAAMLALMLMMTAGAMAEEITPLQFMQDNGFMVLDSDMLAEFGADVSAFEAQNDISFAAYIYGDVNFGNVILWFQNGKLNICISYGAFIKMPPSAKSVGWTYADFCQTFEEEFDLFIFGGPGISYFYPRNTHGAAFAGSMPPISGDKKETFWSMEKFILAYQKEIK